MNKLQEQRRQSLDKNQVFELTGYITDEAQSVYVPKIGFQSSFELTGYITTDFSELWLLDITFQSSFELIGYITYAFWNVHEY